MPHVLGGQFKVRSVAIFSGAEMPARTVRTLIGADRKFGAFALGLHAVSDTNQGFCSPTPISESGLVAATKEVFII